MALKRSLALAGCLALATAGCSLNASSDGGLPASDVEVSSDPGIDAQQVVDDYNEARGDELVPAYDQTYDMTLDMDIEVDGQTMNVGMDIQGEDSASQKLSKADLSMNMRVEGAGEADGSVEMIFGEEEGEHRVYLRSDLDTGEWIQGSMSEDEARQFYAAQDYPTRFNNFVTSAETVGVREEGDSYIIEIVPSEEAMEDLLRTSAGGDSSQIGDVSLKSGSFVLTIDKETHHTQKIEMDYDLGVTVQSQEANMTVEFEGTFDDSQDVTIDIPQEAKDAPEEDIQSYLDLDEN